MKRPAYGPLETRMIGEYGPNPLIPSWTIFPGAIATSTTLDPHALPTVPMSMPWSSDHALGASTSFSGLSGKTRPLEVGDPPVDSRIAPPFALCLTSARSAAAVLGPTVPLGGLRACAVWNLITVALVIGPKYPSAVTR